MYMNHQSYPSHIISENKHKKIHLDKKKCADAISILSYIQNRDRATIMQTSISIA